MTVIYVISEGPDGPVKIGKSANVIRRMDDIQAANPRKLKLLETWQVDIRNVHRVEKEIHAALTECRIVGEWFNLTEDRASKFMDSFFEGRLFQHFCYRPSDNSRAGGSINIEGNLRGENERGGAESADH